MNKNSVKDYSIIFLFSLISCSAQNSNENTIIQLKTTLGDITISLYDDTPLHRDNFIKLVNSGFYDGISFHRVIQNFMIQGGDPSTRTVSFPESADSLNTYTVPSEFNRLHFHKKGAVAAAREGNNVNPEMSSSGTQFYIVQGTVFNELSSKKAIDTYKRMLQRAYVDRLTSIINPTSPAGGITITFGGAGSAGIDAKKSDVTAIVRAQLIGLRSQLNSASATAADKMSKIHLADLAERIKDALDPK